MPLTGGVREMSEHKASVALSAGGFRERSDDLLQTVDLLSGGRVNPGVSVGPPMHWDQVKDALYPGTAEAEDFSYARVERLLSAVRGEPVTGVRGTEGFEAFSDRVQPHSPGLASRLWYGGGSLRSAQWAGEHGMNFLTSSVVKAEESEDFLRPCRRADLLGDGLGAAEIEVERTTPARLVLRAAGEILTPPRAARGPAAE